MLDFRAVYTRAEVHITAVTAGLFVFAGFLIVFQTFFSPLFLAAALGTLAFVVLAIRRPFWVLMFLAVYLPFETVILKYSPSELFVFLRYASEGLIYLLAAVVLIKMAAGSIKPRHSLIDLPFILFLIALVASAIINTVPPAIAILGARQILRFILIFFVAYYLRPPRAYIQSLTIMLFCVVIFQSLLGIAQRAVGEPLDRFLLPSETYTVRDITVSAAVEQFWEPGSRVFGTLGRYDRLGGFLYFFLLLVTGFLYPSFFRKHRRALFALFLIGIAALIFTYSRSSWFAFLIGFLFVSLWAFRDRRVAWAFGAAVIAFTLYVSVSGLNVRNITEARGQTLAERFYETFSYARWRGEYYGLGRLFWMAQTPLTVVPASPMFGFGPGQFGGGAVAALGNTRVYEQLGLPFGVFGTEGSIDNNWFALWGETGTIGLILFLWMYLALFRRSIRVFRSAKDPFARALAIGYAAAMIGVAFNAFLATSFEIRTLAFYLWLYGGFVAGLDSRSADVIPRVERAEGERIGK